MTIEISTVIDERAYIAYVNARNISRDTMAYGVFPNCVKALEEYEALVARLSDPSDLAGFANYHATSTAPVAPYITQLQQAMTVIVQTMIAIDAYAIEATGGPAFGITLPVAVVTKEEPLNEPEPEYLS